MEISLHMPLLRHFLRTSNCSDGMAVLRKAVVDGEPSAVQLLLLCTKVRANRRTRRNFQQVADAMRVQPVPRWLSRLAKQMFNLYQLLTLMSSPTTHRPSSTLELSRGQQRQLAHTGAVRVNRTTLADAASQAATELYIPTSS